MGVPLSRSRRSSTANELHLPVGQTGVLRTCTRPTSSTPSGCPQLGGKRDVVPGRVNHITLTPEVPGEYYGQCAEFCGVSHANMRFRVIVDEPAEFEKWVAAQQAPPVEPAGRARPEGKELFTPVGVRGLPHHHAGSPPGTRARPHPLRQPQDLRRRRC